MTLGTKPEGEYTLALALPGNFGLVPLRTCVLDEAWHAAHAHGTRQLVLLGAGLDGRAFRLNDIGDSTVFEVDHPSTQQLKRKRVRKLASRAQRHVFVPVDFERDKLADALEASGQRKNVPTLWIWEGVTAYLTRQAQQATLDAIAKRSSCGSRLAMTYVEPADEEKEIAGIHRLVRMLGEPFVGLMTRNDTERLGRSGLRVIEDSDAQDWRRRYADSPNRAPDSFRERIVAAETIS